MNASAIFAAIVRFACVEAALFAASIRLAQMAGWRNAETREERWLAVLAIQVTLESSLAALFSFAGLNSPVMYWSAAALCLLGAVVRRSPWSARVASRPASKPPGVDKSGSPRTQTLAYALIAALVAPVVLLSFKPVEELDSLNYLHYLIEWMANRATPYTFATNYVAFWELSFLPTWMVTGLDLFFPLIALKAILLMALGLCLLGKELGVRRELLLWTVFGCVAMQHFWHGPSGVPTLKNDPLHGAGFVLMAVVILRASKRRLTSADVILMAFGISFAAVKYTGVFVGPVAIAMVLLLQRAGPLPLQAPNNSSTSVVGCDGVGPLSGRRTLAVLAVASFFLLTSGHYYVHNLLSYGSPFYPFQINIAFLHLPGTADLSDTSILYSLRDPRLWRTLFLPDRALSPAGLLFPVILAATLLASGGRCLRAAFFWLSRRTKPSPLDCAALFILIGWLMYFRSVFSASSQSGDLSFLVNNLNSIRYVDGVLAASEVFLVALLTRFTWISAPLVAVNLMSRLAILYGQMQVFRPLTVCAVAVLSLMLFLALRRRAMPVAFLALVTVGPFVVQRNRERWTTFWNDLKPAILAVRGQGLAELALTDVGYFSGHMVAAGSPVDPSVRALLPEEIESLPAGARPHFLVVLALPGSDLVVGGWESRYRSAIVRWGYQALVRGKNGVVFKRLSIGIN